jgi:lysophospholipase L1-like esterase
MKYGIAFALILATGAASAAPATSSHPVQEHWVTTWEQPMTSQRDDTYDGNGKVIKDAEGNAVQVVPTVSDFTLRQVVIGSIGTDKLRLRFSNVFGRVPLHIDGTHVALDGCSFSVAKGSDHVVTFAGKGSVDIPAGSEMVSDPVDMHLPALTRIAVTSYFKGATELADRHTYEPEPTAYAVRGNALQATSLAGRPALSGLSTDTDPHIYLLTGVEAVAPVGTRSVIAIGDSITDGALSTSLGKSWPAAFSALANGKDGPGAAVGNAGIGGNQLAGDPHHGAGAGMAAIKRLYRDALDRPGVTDIIVPFGTNDIFGGADDALEFTGARARDLTEALRLMVDVTHQHGIHIWLGTMTAFGGNQQVPARLAERDAFVAWIKANPAGADGVIDFAGVTQGKYVSPEEARGNVNAEGLATVCAADKGVHPNDRGYAAMGTEAYNTLFARHVAIAQPCSP